jgi:hypothetical protein
MIFSLVFYEKGKLALFKITTFGSKKEPKILSKQHYSLRQYDIVWQPKTHQKIKSFKGRE